MPPIEAIFCTPRGKVCARATKPRASIKVTTVSRRVMAGSPLAADHIKGAHTQSLADAMPLTYPSRGYEPFSVETAPRVDLAGSLVGSGSAWTALHRSRTLPVCMEQLEA